MVGHNKDNINISSLYDENAENPETHTTKVDYVGSQPSDLEAIGNNIGISKKQNKLANTLSEGQVASAEYIVSMLDELSLLAQKSNFMFLSYLIEMAKDEALSELDKSNCDKA